MPDRSSHRTSKRSWNSSRRDCSRDGRACGGSALLGALDGLAERDSQLVDRVLGGDVPINQLHIEIDSRCFTLLALHQPMAVDLRAIVVGA